VRRVGAVVQVGRSPGGELHSAQQGGHLMPADRGDRVRHAAVTARVGAKGGRRDHRPPPRSGAPPLDTVWAAGAHLKQGRHPEAVRRRYS